MTENWYSGIGPVMEGFMMNGEFVTTGPGGLGCVGCLGGTCDSFFT